MTGMHPIEFTQKTIIALKAAMKLVDQRSKEKLQTRKNDDGRIYPENKYWNDSGDNSRKYPKNRY